MTLPGDGAPRRACRDDPCHGPARRAMRNHVARCLRRRAAPSARIPAVRCLPSEPRRRERGVAHPGASSAVPRLSRRCPASRNLAIPAMPCAALRRRALRRLRVVCLGSPCLPCHGFAPPCPATSGLTKPCLPCQALPNQSHPGQAQPRPACHPIRVRPSHPCADNRALARLPGESTPGDRLPRLGWPFLP
jgi:hypothetical protein